MSGRIGRYFSLGSNARTHLNVVRLWLQPMDTHCVLPLSLSSPSLDLSTIFLFPRWNFLFLLTVLDCNPPDTCSRLSSSDLCVAQSSYIDSTGAPRTLTLTELLLVPGWASCCLWAFALLEEKGEIFWADVLFTYTNWFLVCRLIHKQ